VFLNILVGVDGSPSSGNALSEAVELAQAEGSLLTLICVAPLVSSYVALGGVSSDRMAADLDEWAGQVLEEARSAVPDRVIAHTVQKLGHAGEEIVAELERGSYDLVVLGSRGRGRLQEGFLGSVTGYVHFHSRVPILSVPLE
jgi:nucleotide-binding universal stress UspA family protein